MSGREWGPSALVLHLLRDQSRKRRHFLTPGKLLHPLWAKAAGAPQPNQPLLSRRRTGSHGSRGLPLSCRAGALSRAPEAGSRTAGSRPEGDGRGPCCAVAWPSPRPLPACCSSGRRRLAWVRGGVSPDDEGDNDPPSRLQRPWRPAESAGRRRAGDRHSAALRCSCCSSRRPPRRVRAVGGHRVKGSREPGEVRTGGAGSGSRRAEGRGSQPPGVAAPGPRGLRGRPGATRVSVGGLGRPFVLAQHSGWSGTAGASWPSALSPL